AFYSCTASYSPACANPHTFVDKNDVFSVIAVPGADFTIPGGINNAGQIVGSFVNDNDQHCFLKSSSVFTSFDVLPHAGPTLATDINNAGQITGWFEDNATQHGFSYTNGVFTTFDAPGAAYGT